MIENKKFAHENNRFVDSRRDVYQERNVLYDGLMAFTQLMTIAVIVFGG